MDWGRVLWRFVFPMDALSVCLGLGPVAVYVVLLGWINLSRRPFLVSGARDAAALGLAISGFVVVGPIRLFFPAAAAIRFGPYVWVLLLAFYTLCLVLVLLLLRPRLIIYNIPAEQLRPLLAELVDQLDSNARWADDMLVLPTLGVKLYVDNPTLMCNTSLISVGPNQNHLGWRRLELALAAALDRVEVAGNARGVGLISTGVLIAAGLIYAIARDPQAVAQALFDMLML